MVCNENLPPLCWKSRGLRRKESGESMTNYARIQDLKNGEVFRVVQETDGEVYFYDEFDRWSYFNKSEEGTSYRYIPKGARLENEISLMPCGKKHNKYVWCSDCHSVKEGNT